jgi:hypothetical protein
MRVSLRCSSSLRSGFLGTSFPWPYISIPSYLIVEAPSSVNNNALCARIVLTGVNRYFPYWITVASLTVLFIIVMLWLISQRQLLPGIVIMGSFILFILWVVGLIVISIELWGPTGSVNSNCQLYVSATASRGQSIDTLAYLEQHSICKLRRRDGVL